MTAAKHGNAESAGSGFAPLRQPVFAVLWVATVLGNVGTFIRDVASAWLVTDLSASPSAVAMVQAAGTLPIFLLAIPAGVLSDILDRRRLLIVIQLCLACISGTLALLAHAGELTVTSLVALTFLGGVGAALMAPTWQAVVPELVSRADLKNAVALNSIGFNIARAIGPAIGGLLLAGFGAAVTYGADVASYLLVICALLWWRRKGNDGDELQEHFFGAFRAGLRYARASRPLHIVLLRAGLFFIFASSAWVLLPLVARSLLNGGPGYYGLLLGAVGAGSILGAFVLPMLRRALSSDNLMLGAALIAAAVMACLSFAPPQWLAVVILLLLGVGWITALTTLNGITQSILPNWVRGRGLAIYLTVFNGALAAGSLLWGGVAEQIGIPNTLLVAAAALVVMAMVARALPLPSGEEDLTPSNHWPEPLLAEPVAHDRGPVLITITYRIRKADRPVFWSALKPLAEVRRRDGAYAWGVSEDTSDSEHIKEWFFVESWAEHLRQHRRISHADADLQKDVLALHAGPDKPVVEHFLALEKPDRKH
ncbi:MFS transporter [Ferrovibrio sp.]|uniref:MFS transporter n=1 Tax=Ferrovibrio sp. TaxID=1917215 RepID=UPI0035AE0439